MSYPIPNRKPEPSYHSGLIIYQLTDVERAYLDGGELHRIPTADQRGLKPEPPMPLGTKLEAIKYDSMLRRSYTGKYKHVTKELLQRELASGKLLNDIAEEQGVPRGMMDYLLKINGLASRGDGG
ncbi:hypothetical protein [Cohnella luojiensis]|uniref:Uncharacterized protein n=1 Tax=Cohnella luojiensis TaxID=652876 RepID=A0A4Y8M784_9BACL|nr:hypothetical protein [Cohnella luojiensis]TFE30821.1 hypothetical protein E2980_03320 [Cohnella luojiensis]